ncbi:MAG: hypothetical protein H6619_02900 [Deltaproteobacteria bacterium]|nr:hypothetical protein [Deltaproteobacteria bacterium]
MKRQDSANVLVELVVVVVVLYAVFNAIFAFHTMLEIRRDINAAYFAAFNSKKYDLFTTNQAGDIVPWSTTSTPDANTGILNSVNNWLGSNLGFGSNLFQNTSDITCQTAICYLNVNTTSGSPNIGWVIDTPAFDICTPDISSPGTDAHLNLMKAQAANYQGRMVDMHRPINPIESEYVLDPNNTANSIQVVLDYAPFFVWACTGEIRILLWTQTFEQSGVYVPKR